MSRGIDAVLERLDGGIYDIKFDFDGDIETADFFDTAIIVSIMSDRRANEAEVRDASKRRGWIGDEVREDGHLIGSTLWLFQQSRLTRSTMNAVEDSIRESLQWMVEDGIAEAIENVSLDFAPPESPVTGLVLEIAIRRTISEVETRFFNLFEQTGIRNLAGDVPLVVITPFSQQGTSIDFDGVTENMLSAGSQDLGIENAWSAAVWWKPRASNFSSLTGSEIFLFRPGGAGLLNRITLTLRGNVANDPFQANLRDSAGTQFKSYQWDNLATVDEWNFTLVTWDGSNLKLYQNGVLVVETGRAADVIGTMTDENRELKISGDLDGTGMDGLIHSIGVWSAAHDSAGATALFNGGNGRAVDWKDAAPLGDDLQHWWRLGFDSSDLGKDFGRAAPLIDANALSTGITVSDISSDSPS